MHNLGNKIWKPRNNIFVCRISKTVEDSVCLAQVGNKPATLAACNVGIVCPEWHIGAWQPVRIACADTLDNIS